MTTTPKMYTIIIMCACIIGAEKESVTPTQGKAQVLQQLSKYENSKAVRNYMRSVRRNPGYRPVITVLPEGLNFSASAVVSADRRYVRIQAMPIISSIGDVHTFTFSGGP